MTDMNMANVNVNADADSDDEVTFTQATENVDTKATLMASSITCKLALEEKIAQDDYKDKYGSKCFACVC